MYKRQAFIVFSPQTKAFDPVVSFTRNGQQVAPLARPPVIKIQRASYGVPGDAARTRDVLAKVQEWADRWYTTARSFMQTTRGFVKYKHQRQSQQCPMRSPIKDCCLLLPTQEAVAAPRQTDALLSQSILAYHSFSLCFLFRTEQTMEMEPRT